MRSGLLVAGCFVYFGGLAALLAARDSALNPPHFLHGAPETIPTPGMMILFALAIVPGVVLIFLGMVLQTDPRFKRLDTLLAIAGLAVLLLLGLGSVVVFAG